MKTKRFAKIATLVLAAALLICGVIGITTSAEENGATEVSIAGKNVAYEGALKLVYYVDAPGFDAETQALKMNFWIGTKSETPAITAPAPIRKKESVAASKGLNSTKTPRSSVSVGII